MPSPRSNDLLSRSASTPHSRMTLRYLPASKILCFQGSRNLGMQAPPGRRDSGVLAVPRRGGGMPLAVAAALPRKGWAIVEPSRS